MMIAAIYVRKSTDQTGVGDEATCLIVAIGQEHLQFFRKLRGSSGPIAAIDRQTEISRPHRYVVPARPSYGLRQVSQEVDLSLRQTNVRRSRNADQVVPPKLESKAPAAPLQVVQASSLGVSYSQALQQVLDTQPVQEQSVAVQTCSDENALVGILYLGVANLYARPFSINRFSADEESHRVGPPQTWRSAPGLELFLSLGA